jgi:hypothetical protein
MAEGRGRKTEDRKGMKDEGRGMKLSFGFLVLSVELDEIASARRIGPRNDGERVKKNGI